MKNAQVLLLSVLLLNISYGIEKFMPNQGYQTQVWRITNDPSVRDWANYHNTDAWSPDGRYICWERWPYLTTPDYPADRGKGAEVYIIDLKTQETKLVGKGSNPRWASRNNWLFFIQEGSNVMWYKPDEQTLTKLVGGVQEIGETDSQDRWIYGSTAPRDERTPMGTAVRIPLTENATPQPMPNARGNFALPNPVYPRVLYRVDGLAGRHQQTPFSPLHVMTDLEGNNEQILSPKIRHGHQTWSGDGQWFLLGNGQMRGRRWDEPFPSNEHYLAAISCGDISPCGRSGRWVVGGNNIGSMQIADLRSGDGRNFLRSLSFVHYYGDWHANDMGDTDLKGSPDGTKVVFSSNYDLKDAPHTKIAEDMTSADADKIIVESTEGFPASGRISIQAEIIGYKSKTANSFEGLTRQMYGVRAQNPGVLSYLPPELFEHYTKNPTHHTKGMIVTSFDARLIDEQKRKDMLMPDRDNLPDGWKENPITFQRRTDVYVAVVRKPDRPLLRFSESGETMIELIPGENHWEIRGYYIFVDGKKLNEEPLAPGEIISLGYASSGNAHLHVEAAAVEWSGLESDRSIALDTVGRGKGKRTLEVLKEAPKDFSWTYECFVAAGREMSPQRAKGFDSYTKNIIHIYYGLIAKEQYANNAIVLREDFNELGQATRRLHYSKGILTRREYFNRDNVRVSEEIFDLQGYIVESRSWAYDLYLNDMILEEPYLENQWFYEKGMPVRLKGSDSYNHFTCFPGIYETRGDNWIKLKSLPSPQIKVKR